VCCFIKDCAKNHKNRVRKRYYEKVLYFVAGTVFFSEFSEMRPTT